MRQRTQSLRVGPVESNGRSARRVPLARKGMWVLVAVGLYLIAATAIIAIERDRVLAAVTELQTVHAREEDQLALNLAVSHAVLEVNEKYFSPDVPAAAQELGIEVDAIVSRLRNFNGDAPALAQQAQVLEKIGVGLADSPTREDIVTLRMALHALVINLDVMTYEIREKKARVLADYSVAYDRVMTEWLTMVVVGVAGFGGIGLLFFKNLSRDIGRVKERAIAIVRGYRGAHLAVSREDELGDLMAAVNQMQSELNERDVKLELARQQHFHTEKMAAVGSLAAAVAHEINNPLAAIAGIAENIEALQATGQCGSVAERCQPSLILEQTRRVMAITRQISEITVQRPLLPELANLNALVRSTVSFISFDRRFRGITLEQTLDAQLPAVVVVSDHIVQMLMNLLINAADALEASPRQPPRISVRTQQGQGQVEIWISDNGPGIGQEIIGRVFEERFTTKAPGRGSGLGLSVCRALIRQDGGDLTLESVVDVGTTAKIFIPLVTRNNTEDATGACTGS